MKILFQGDSITDAGRDRRNYHDLGNGYPKYAAKHIVEMHPDADFEFINFGISGNRTSQLFDRLYSDGIEFQPDVISILIGINDIWHRYSVARVATTDLQIETNYRAILERLKKETNAKIVILAPYVLDAETADYLKEDEDAEVFLCAVSGERLVYSVVDIKADTDTVISFDVSNVRRAEKFIIGISGGTTPRLCIAEGYISREGGSIIKRRLSATPSEDSEYSLTEYERIDASDGISLVRLDPITGRTHQLRLHLSSIDCPISGDTMYGCASEEISRQALHAYSLRFPSPIDGSEITVLAPLPTDMLKFAEEHGLEATIDLRRNK